MNQAKACQGSAVSSLRDTGAGPRGQRATSPQGSPSLAGFKLLGTSCPGAWFFKGPFLWRSHPWPLCWPQPARLTAPGPRQHLGLAFGAAQASGCPGSGGLWALPAGPPRPLSPLPLRPPEAPVPALGVQGRRGPGSQRALGGPGPLPVFWDLPLGRWALWSPGAQGLGEAPHRGGLGPCGRARRACPVHPWAALLLHQDL